MKIYDNDYYYEDERLYSTGNDDLDILLEKAFCDGYEYAQREYSIPQRLAGHQLKKIGSLGKKAGDLIPKYSKHPEVQLRLQKVRDRAKSIESAYNHPLTWKDYRKLSSTKKDLGDIVGNFLPENVGTRYLSMG